MKQLFSVLTLVILVAAVAFAQEPKTMGKAGDKAFLFSLNGLSNLGAGNYFGGVGLRYHFSGSTAGRVGLGFAMNKTTTKVPSGQSGSDDETTVTGFSIAPGVEFRMPPMGSVVGYCGGQVYFGMSNTTHDNINFNSNQSTELKETTFGAGLLAGVEWFPWPEVGLSAEYNLSFTTTTGTQTTKSNGTSTDTDEPSKMNISLGRVNQGAFMTGGDFAVFTLSIYM